MVSGENGKRHILAFAFVLIASIAINNNREAAAMQGIQDNSMRLGIGIASLATKQCAGYRLGPGADRMFRELNAETDEQKSSVLVLAEKEAGKFLKAQNRNICDVAAEMVNDGDLIEKE